MKESITVEFRKKDGISASLNIYSKFTVIVGKDSGEGKSKFLADLIDLISTEQVDIITTNDIPLAIAGPENLKVSLDTLERSIFIIDEASSLTSYFMRFINESKHLFIVICRSMPLKGDYPLCGIYSIEEIDSWYKFNNVNGLRLYNGENVDNIITESAANKSEHELLSIYTDNLIPAGGRDNIAKVIFRTKGSKLVLADLGNIGRSYYILAKRCKDDESVYFYNYQAFEQMLFESNIVNGVESEYDVSNLDLISIERYYETILELATNNMYKHGKSLPAIFLDSDNFDKVFSSDIAKLLRELLSKDCDHYTDFEELIWACIPEATKSSYGSSKREQIDNYKRSHGL